jgi:(2Fe-2S) ferredoxin
MTSEMRSVIAHPRIPIPRSDPGILLLRRVNFDGSLSGKGHPKSYSERIKLNLVSNSAKLKKLRIQFKYTIMSSHAMAIFCGTTLLQQYYIWCVKRKEKPGKGKLTGSSPNVERHIILCGLPSDWPAKLEGEEGSIASILLNNIKKNGVEGIKLTACDLPPIVHGTVDAIVFPEGKRFTIDPSNEMLRHYSNIFCQRGPIDLPKNSEDLPWDHLVLVCTHTSRDKRCGRAGPIILAELKSEVEKSNLITPKIQVCGSSHIGGHKYAATLIVYPRGLWYGMVTKKLVPSLLQDILENDDSSRCVEKVDLESCNDVCTQEFREKCFRGLGSVDW